MSTNIKKNDLDDQQIVINIGKSSIKQTFASTEDWDAQNNLQFLIVEEGIFSFWLVYKLFAFYPQCFSGLI
jgi:hypothetical protein